MDTYCITDGAGNVKGLPVQTVSGCEQSSCGAFMTVPPFRPPCWVRWAVNEESRQNSLEVVAHDRARGHMAGDDLKPGPVKG